jgi:hypothetical protein
MANRSRLDLPRPYGRMNCAIVRLPCLIEEPFRQHAAHSFGHGTATVVVQVDTIGPIGRNIPVAQCGGEARVIGFPDRRSASDA